MSTSTWAQTVVLIGPNSSGKTTALQALALWDNGVQHDDLFSLAEAERRSQAMRETIAEVAAALLTLRRIEP